MWGIKREKIVSEDCGVENSCVGELFSRHEALSSPSAAGIVETTHGILEASVSSSAQQQHAQHGSLSGRRGADVPSACGPTAVLGTRTQGPTLTSDNGCSEGETALAEPKQLLPPQKREEPGELSYFINYKEGTLVCPDPNPVLGAQGLPLGMQLFALDPS